MKSNTEEIKERLSIADVIGGYIKLEKAGANFRARCPFHNEKTPSFFISPSRQSYYCFGCGAKGDIFTFVERLEGLDFRGALKLLAERAGVSLVFSSSKDEGERDRLHTLLETATLFFEGELRNTPKAVDYLKERGLLEATMKRFRLGYSPPEWRALTSYLKSKGFSESLIEKAGLGKMASQGMYDRFRGRIMFPIADASGRIIAFSGRIFDASHETKESVPAKYVNSPETELFSKSKVLYGFDKAKEGIRRLNAIVVVEGQMDMLMSVQAGFTNTVALSGTALSEFHIDLIKRLTGNIILSLDSDAAGIRASAKSGSFALKKGLDVKVAALEGSKDPADLIRESPSEWKEAIKGAIHLIDYFLLYIEKRGYDERKFRLEVVRAVLPYVALIESRTDRAHFAKKIADRLHLPETSIIEELKRIPTETVSTLSRTSAAVLTEEVSRIEKIKMLLAGLLLDQAASRESGIDIDHVREEMERILGPGELAALLSNQENHDPLYFEAERFREAGKRVVAETENLLLFLEYEILKERLGRLRWDLKEKETSGAQGFEEILDECNKISQRISILGATLKKNE